MMIELVESDPRKLRKALVAEIDNGNWGASEFIAYEAAGDVWYNVYLYTERNDGELIAIGTAEIADDECLEILNLASRKRRRGCGTLAVNAFKDLARELGTIIKLKAASEAVRFWEKVGAEIDDCYYGDEPGGALMWMEV